MCQRLADELDYVPRINELPGGVQAMADEVWAWCAKASAFGRTVR
jgi:hypothetical protein